MHQYQVLEGFAVVGPEACSTVPAEVAGCRRFKVPEIPPHATDLGPIPVLSHPLNFEWPTPARDREESPGKAASDLVACFVPAPKVES